MNQSNAYHFTAIQRASPIRNIQNFSLNGLTIFFCLLFVEISFFSSSIKSKDKLPLKSIFFFGIHPHKFKNKALRINLPFPLHISSLGYEIINKNWKKIKAEILFYDDLTEGQRHKFPGEF